jgi:hypothetical protein
VKNRRSIVDQKAGIGILSVKFYLRSLMSGHHTFLLNTTEFCECKQLITEVQYDIA